MQRHFRASKPGTAIDAASAFEARADVRADLVTAAVFEGAVVLRARGLALVFLGVSLSYVVGLPLGAWAGLGWGWRVPTWAAAALTAVSGLALWLAVPRGTHGAAGHPQRGPHRLPHRALRPIFAAVSVPGW
jgi:predicted MFS family arabinose efflux permease